MVDFINLKISSGRSYMGAPVTLIRISEGQRATASKIAFLAGRLLHHIASPCHHFGAAVRNVSVKKRRYNHYIEFIMKTASVRCPVTRGNVTSSTTPSCQNLRIDLL